MPRRYHYSVYVVELSLDVLDEARFRRANPGYAWGKPCVYVGMTGLSPDVRFAVERIRKIQGPAG